LPVQTRWVRQCGQVIVLFDVAPHAPQCLAWRVPGRIRPTLAPHRGHRPGVFLAARGSDCERCRGASSRASTSWRCLIGRC